jgi:hypothetical protein
MISQLRRTDRVIYLWIIYIYIYSNYYIKYKYSKIHVALFVCHYFLVCHCFWLCLFIELFIYLYFLIVHWLMIDHCLVFISIKITYLLTYLFHSQNYICQQCRLPVSDHDSIIPHSSPVCQLTEKSSFHWKEMLFRR